MLLVYVFGLPILAGRCLKRHESSVLGIMRIMYEKQRQDLRLRFEEEVKKAEQKARGESQPQSTSSKCCRRLTADERLKKNKAKQAKQAKHLFDDATNTVRRRFSFLFLGYRSETYWFESVVLLRKACLNIVVVLFARDPYLQSELAMLVILLAALVHASQRPFNQQIFNYLEAFSLCTTGCTYFLGQFTLEVVDSTPERIF